MMSIPEPFAASAQTTAPDWVSGGCNWSTTFGLTIPPGWPSGIYAAQCSDTNGDTFHIVFIVKPVWSGRKILALASTNTWSAYNDWGGHSKYGPNYTTVLTFLRPNRYTTPVDDGQINHLTRADLWILGWLEDRGYLPDVITDTDLHKGFGELNQYAALILNSHPEYWSLEMVDAVQSYLGAGGSILYLGGNGMFERCIFNADASSLTFFNGGDSDGGDVAHRAPAFLRNQSPPRPERAILGVGFLFSSNNWGGDAPEVAYPYEVRMAEHPLFAGTGVTNGTLIGQTGRQGGGASGWEMDTSISGNHGDDGFIVSATVGETDRGTAPSGLLLLARGTNTGHSADMTYYDTGEGGFVFSVGSICFGGSLVQDAVLQAVVKNALSSACSRPKLVGLTLSPDTVICGDSSLCTVTLDPALPLGPAVVLVMTSAPGFATVPAQVTIARGQASQKFTITTPNIAIPFKTAVAPIQAESFGNIVTATLTVKSRVVAGVLKSLTISPTAVTGGESATGTVTLEKAVLTDTTVGLAALEPGSGPLGLHGGPSSVARVPPSIIIPAGQSSRLFTITTNRNLSPHTKREAVIEADAVVTLSATLTVTL
jgi:hypothetical protein